MRIYCVLFFLLCGGSECKIDCLERYEANKRGRYGDGGRPTTTCGCKAKGGGIIHPNYIFLGEFNCYFMMRKSIFAFLLHKDNNHPTPPAPAPAVLSIYEGAEIDNYNM